MPYLIVMTGANGSGKTTAAPALFRDSQLIDYFVNADVIAQGLCAYQPEKVAIQAGRIFLKTLHSLAERQQDFAFETTLASRTFATWIPSLKQQGYHFHLIFLWLKNAELAVLRVKERTQQGGHFVPENTVKRRYVSGLRNFFKIYRSLADSWQFYDNSDNKNFSLIASANNQDDFFVQNKTLWTQLSETYTDD